LDSNEGGTTQFKFTFMKSLYLLIIITFVSSGVYCQNVETLLIEFVGSNERLVNLKQTNPGYISYLEKRISSGYIITEYNPARHSDAVVVFELSKKNRSEIISESVAEFLESYFNGSLNILLYVFPDHSDQNLTLKLGDTNYVMVLYSNSYINALLINEN
jgi:hypothetical protein